jgi:hypothetical protein
MPITLQLADRPLRERLQDEDPARDLEHGQALRDELAKVVGARDQARAQHDGGGNVPRRVGCRGPQNVTAWGHGRMAQERGVHFLPARSFSPPRLIISLSRPVTNR